jgi:hypothetical protein
MLQFLIYFFIFRFFFIAKGFWNFSDRWFSITAISEFAGSAWWWWFGKEGDGHRG